MNKKDLYYLECVINQSDNERAWDIWQTLKEELAQRANNTQSKQCQCGCDLQDHICPTGLLRFTEVCA